MLLQKPYSETTPSPCIFYFKKCIKTLNNYIKLSNYSYIYIYRIYMILRSFDLFSLLWRKYLLDFMTKFYIYIVLYLYIWSPTRLLFLYITRRNPCIWALWSLTMSIYNVIRTLYVRPKWIINCFKWSPTSSLELLYNFYH